MSRAPEGTFVDVVTPEGVPLRFRIGTAGDRLVGFIIDWLIIGAFLLVFGLLGTWAGSQLEAASWASVFWLLAVFFLRNFYFTFFELRWQGRTPGKKRAGLRVMDRHGGTLSAEAIVVRNLTRELELFLPLMVLFSPETLWPGAPGWARGLASLWMLGFGFMPLFSKMRLRVGDLVAGTMVVVAPTAQLLPDQSSVKAEKATHVFTDPQLDIYGIYELQVLEGVLRQVDRSGAEAWLAAQSVAEKIQAKIGYTAPGKLDVVVFLRDFYAALRARLEQRMLLGDRKEDKYASGGQSTKTKKS